MLSAKMAMTVKSLFKQIDEAFKLGDLQSKGYLDHKDYKVAMIALTGKKPYKWELSEIFTKFDKLNKDDFQMLALKKMRERSPVEHMREIFSALDTERKGYLVLEDLEKAQHLVFPNLPKYMTKEAFYEADVDSYGRITFEDFFQFIKGKSLTTNVE